MDYDKLLQICPPHDSDSFIEFLRAKNPVTFEDEEWIVVENYKYHSKSTLHYTAFVKRFVQYPHELDVKQNDSLTQITRKYKGWFIYVNPDEQRSVYRLHYHFVKNYENWVNIMYDALKLSDK